MASDRRQVAAGRQRFVRTVLFFVVFFLLVALFRVERGGSINIVVPSTIAARPSSGDTDGDSGTGKRRAAAFVDHDSHHHLPDAEEEEGHHRPTSAAPRRDHGPESEGGDEEEDAALTTKEKKARKAREEGEEAKRLKRVKEAAADDDHDDQQEGGEADQPPVRTIAARGGGKKRKPKATPAPAPPEAEDAGSAADEDGGDDERPVTTPRRRGRRGTTPPPETEAESKHEEVDDIDQPIEGEGVAPPPTTQDPQDPIVTVTQDETYKALFEHEYHDAATLRRVISAVDRPWPKWRMRRTDPLVMAAPEDAPAAPAWVERMEASIVKAWDDPAAPDVVPTMVIPLFHDGPECEALLGTIDAPVRLFVFVWNSKSQHVRRVVDNLKRFTYGVVIHHTAENVGFSGAVNTGVRSSRTFLKKPVADWYFIVNADTEFPKSVLPGFASSANALDKEQYGLIYGPRQDHFAFAITKAAVDTVGYFDEVFYPGYMEDIDYYWRVRLGGLRKRVTGARFRHKKSTNDRKPKSVTGNYQAMLVRASRGWEYGWMKWGRYGTHQIEKDFPPSGRRTPFNIPNAPLGLWALDAGVRFCVRTNDGKGVYHVKSSTCWYNGTMLLAKLPPGTKLTKNLLVPGPTGR